jgi:hypothetical protein
MEKKTAEEILKYLPSQYPLSATWKKATKEAVIAAMKKYAALQVAEKEAELLQLREAVLKFAKSDWINEEQTPDFKNAWDNLTETAGVFYSYPVWQLKSKEE